ncbi:MAG: HYR domain-containing protein [Nitrosopumilus sp.]|nr:HYR domain-containing protein [Nitrosopumilus sp.]
MPIITAPSDYTVALPQNQTSISLNSTDYGTATATDIFAVTITDNAPLSFSLGNFTITWTATDTSGNAATANQTVTVTP